MPGDPSSVLYFDLASPYAYLAVARAAAVLPDPPELEPILVGAIFRWRGSGSWAHTPIRDMRVAEIEARAARYGLPPLVWPASWPANALAAMRAATWAREQGRLEPFVAAVYRAEFARGEDVADLSVLAACAQEAGLDGAALRAAIERPAIKEQLRAATTAAWEAGVRGVPTLIRAGVVYFGDDQLELAAVP
ncbi:MAG TPA: DsbA family protein [Solirubrobacteraceae bacterium]|nr:DsbA family protein [Solirubrobacteraceae bacterium]